MNGTCGAGGACPAGGRRAVPASDVFMHRRLVARRTQVLYRWRWCPVRNVRRDWCSVRAILTVLGTGCYTGSHGNVGLVTLDVVAVKEAGWFPWQCWARDASQRNSSQIIE